MDKTFDDQFLKDFVKDMMNEKQFLDAVGAVRKKYMLSEFEAMAKVYNEVLDGFVKNRFDVEIFNIMAGMDPEGGITQETPVNNAQKFKNAKQSLKNRKITLDVCRRQILMSIGKYEKKRSKE